MKTRATALLTTLILTLLTAALSQPTASAVPQSPKRYLVQTDSSKTTGAASQLAAGAGGRVIHRYAKVFSGFSAELTAGQAQALAANAHVTSVIPDEVTHAGAVEANPPWGLDRIDQRLTVGDKKYTYDSTGSGVTVFVIDTGIRFSHHQFGGRAVSGWDFVDDDGNASDCAGHGTHVSGTIGGSTYGVAKAVKFVSVRVWDCNGSGWATDMMSALDWVVAHKPQGRAVVNISGGGDSYTPLDDSVKKTVAAGVSVVVAAANDNSDACSVSPAEAPDAITVGATDVSDRRASFSNFGECVDLFAPGVDVLSSTIDSDVSTGIKSGTSMATPHVTGIVARYLQRHPDATPAQTTAALLAGATPGVVADPQGSPNRLSYVAPVTVTVPSKPTSTKVTRSDAAKTATLTWKPPVSNGGSVITGYRVARNGTDSKGVGPVSVVVPATTRSYTFGSLRAGATYPVSVRASTAIGTSAAASLEVKITALPGKPGIRKPSRGSRSDHKVSVTAKWAAATSGGRVATYSVTAINKKSGAKKTVTASRTARSKKITGLKRNAWYVVQVRGVNASGKGPLSARSTSVKAR